MAEELKPKTIEDIEIVETENGKAAVLKNATLVEDIRLVQAFAVENNIKYYAAIKDEGNGVLKTFVLNHENAPTIIENGTYGVNIDYKEEVVEEVKEVEEVTNEETIEEVVVETNTEDGGDVEVASEETTIEECEDEHKIELETQEDCDCVHCKELEDELSKLRAEKNALEEKLSIIEIGNNLTNSETTITLEDVKLFLENNGLKSISI